MEFLQILSAICKPIYSKNVIPMKRANMISGKNTPSLALQLWRFFQLLLSNKTSKVFTTLKFFTQMMQTPFAIECFIALILFFKFETQRQVINRITKCVAW